MGMGAEEYNFSDEGKLEVAQHTYFQETLGMVVSEVGEEMAHDL